MIFNPVVLMGVSDWYKSAIAQGLSDHAVVLRSDMVEDGRHACRDT